MREPDYRIDVLAPEATHQSDAIVKLADAAKPADCRGWKRIALHVVEIDEVKNVLTLPRPFRFSVETLPPLRFRNGLVKCVKVTKPLPRRYLAPILGRAAAVVPVHFQASDVDRQQFSIGEVVAVRGRLPPRFVGKFQPNSGKRAAAVAVVTGDALNAVVKGAEVVERRVRNARHHLLFDRFHRFVSLLTSMWAGNDAPALVAVHSEAGEGRRIPTSRSRTSARIIFPRRCDRSWLGRHARVTTRTRRTPSRCSPCGPPSRRGASWAGACERRERVRAHDLRGFRSGAGG